MTLGENLYRMRREKCLSQEEVAHLLGVTRQTVSKWETDQSTPDFDKVLPLCELYQISPNELFGTEAVPQQLQQTQAPAEPEPLTTTELESNEEAKRKKAIAIAISVIIYILGVAWIIVAIPVLKVNPIIATAIFLVVIAIGVGIDIYAGMVFKAEKADEEALPPEQKLEKQIRDMIAAIVLVLYLLISFLTHAWHITWIIWVIYGVIAEIIKLIFMLKENKNEKE